VSDKLDRLVAEKVMGWTVRESDHDNNDYERYTNGWAVSRWNPSTSIEAAWEVVEHLRKQIKEDGSRKYLVSIIDSIGYPEVQIEIICGEDYSSWSGPCDAKAICCAALLAVGVPEATIQEAYKEVGGNGN